MYMKNQSDSIEFGADDSALVRFYHEVVVQSIIYIERTNLETGTVESGTGTMFMVQGNKTDGWLACICTASHVVSEATGARYEYRLIRFSHDDPEEPTRRVATFKSGASGPRDPGVVYYNGIDKDVIDLGFVRAPQFADDGMPFLGVAADGALVPGQIIPSETNLSAWTSEGSSIAWAGYAGLAAEIAGRPIPCYFEGSISAVVMRKEGPLYLIDGSNTFGVSGGPVWAVCSRFGRPRMIGVISSYKYRRDVPFMPGFAHAVPIQPLVSYLAENWKVKFHLPS
jgi:hypothetical protein